MPFFFTPKIPVVFSCKSIKKKQGVSIFIRILIWWSVTFFSSYENEKLEPELVSRILPKYRQKLMVYVYVYGM